MGEEPDYQSRPDHGLPFSSNRYPPDRLSPEAREQVRALLREIGLDLRRAAAEKPNETPS